MRKINKNTKQGKQMLARYAINEGFYLSDVYEKHSNEKETSWRKCLDTCNAENGYNFHICTHNTFGYSVAWENDFHYRIETPNNTYIIDK